MSELRILSLGWGVQSFTLAAMAALGELPGLDAAIHADTRHERQATYTFAATWTPWLAEHGVPVITAVDPAAGDLADANSQNILIPAFTLRATGAPFTSGQALAGGLDARELKPGQLRRQCTARWKIRPLRQEVHRLLRARNIALVAGVCEQWIGISYDEWQRARTSEVQYITNRYPLLEARMTRADCRAWLRAHDLPVPGKSACVFCPLHSTTSWKQLKRQGGADWDHAVEVDRAARTMRPPFDLFVHPSCRPLAQAVVIPEDQGLTQDDMFDRPEDPDAPCDNGGCFL